MGILDYLTQRTNNQTKKSECTPIRLNYWEAVTEMMETVISIDHHSLKQTVGGERINYAAR